MGKKRYMLPVEEVDLNKVKYEHEVLKAPHLMGLKLKIFVWLLETPLIGSLITTYLKKENKITQELQDTVIPERPMFLPELLPSKGLFLRSLYGTIFNFLYKEKAKLIRSKQWKEDKNNNTS